MVPITREEILLNAVATGDSPELKPITREEMFLAKAAGMDVSTPEPITRREMFLSKISGSAGGGSGGDYEAMVAGLADKTITSLIIPTGVTNIASDAFADCTDLQSVVIPDSVTAIGVNAFRGCAFQSVSIPPNLSLLEQNVFAACKKLQTVVIPRSVEEVRAQAFNGCTGLKIVTFKGTPTLSTLYGTYAFVGCTGITDIYVPWAEGEVSGAPWGATNATIHYNYTEG